MKDKQYVVLQNLQPPYNAFWTINHYPNNCHSHEGELWYKEILFTDDEDEAVRVSSEVCYVKQNYTEVTKITNLSFINWDKHYTIICHKETDNGLLPNTHYKKMRPWVGGGSPASSVDFVEQELIDDMGEDYVQEAYENGDEYEAFATVDQQDIDNGSVEIFEEKVS